MMVVNPANERIKRCYFEYQRETLGLSDKTIEHAAAAIYEYEQFIEFRDFKLWSLPRAKRFKTSVMAGASKRTGAPSSRSTGVAKLRLVKNFLLWLATQPGYRGKISRTDAQYLNPLRRDVRLARAPSGREGPTLEQARNVILGMPASSDVELRNRALMACTLLTGARVSALITLKLKHVRDDRSGIIQDPQDVHTKFHKHQETFFFPVGDDIKEIFLSYVVHLRQNLLWGEGDPLFPSTRQTVGDDHQFRVAGLKRQHWVTPEPVRHVFRNAFVAAGLPYFSPHSFRSTLMTLGERICRTPEELKVWSLNLGHEEVQTSMTNYGVVAVTRRQEVMRELAETRESKWSQFQALVNDPEVQAVLAFAAHRKEVL